MIEYFKVSVDIYVHARFIDSVFEMEKRLNGMEIRIENNKIILHYLGTTSTYKSHYDWNVLVAFIHFYYFE